MCGKCHLKGGVMEYGYIRVSTAQQNIDRQLAELLKFGLSEENIFIDYQSGKDFERTEYQNLKQILKQGDLLIIKSIDRLGRNYKAITDEWANLTKIIGCNIFVTDMPLLDTRTTTENLVGTFISDIVLQILSFVAETERQNIRERQAEGIRIAKQKGKNLGHPKKPLPANAITVITAYKNKQLPLQSAIQTLGISRSSFYKLL